MKGQHPSTESDDLEAYISQRAASNPGFAALVEAAEQRRRVLQELGRARKEGGLSRTAVAARMHTSESAVARLEAGQSDPRVSTLERFATAVGKRLAVQVVDV